MSDEIDDTAPRRFDGGVIFKMAALGGFVVVRVTDEALADSEGAAVARSNVIAIFGRRRYAIESAARRKLSKKREMDGSILLRSSDLND
jgi:hypothetical protein